MSEQKTPELKIYRAYGDNNVFYGLELRIGEHEYKISLQDNKITNKGFTPDIGENIEYVSVVSIPLK